MRDHLELRRFVLDSGLLARDAGLQFFNGLLVLGTADFIHQPFNLREALLCAFIGPQANGLVGCGRRAAAFLDRAPHIGHRAVKALIPQNVIDRARNTGITAAIGRVIDRAQIIRQIFAELRITHQIPKATVARDSLIHALRFRELIFGRVELFFHAGKLLKEVSRPRGVENRNALGHYRAGRPENGGNRRRHNQLFHTSLLSAFTRSTKIGNHTAGSSPASAMMLSTSSALSGVPDNTSSSSSKSRSTVSPSTVMRNLPRFSSARADWSPCFMRNRRLNSPRPRTSSNSASVSLKPCV